MNFAAAFGGGFILSHALADLDYPKFSRKRDICTSFKMSVHVVAASVPALTTPGTWTRTRPRLEAKFNGVQKDTELADFESQSKAEPGGWAAECPWRFGDTLTFTVDVKDVDGPGLYLRVRAHKDVSFGPVQFQFTHIADLGEASVDLRHKVLPSCVCDKPGEGTAGCWQSPVLLVPLNAVHGGMLSSGYQLNQAAGHVALVFSLDVDPEHVLKAIEHESRNMVEALESKANHVIQFLEKPLSIGHSESDAEAFEEQYGRAGVGPLLSPDLPKDGWISHRGPSGRLQWHHKSLGPPPWEKKESRKPSASSGTSSSSFSSKPKGLEFGPKVDSKPDSRASGGAGAGKVVIPRSATSFGPVVSPDLPSTGWVSHQGPHGQTYWHNKALGPAPWERRTLLPASA